MLSAVPSDLRAGLLAPAGAWARAARSLLRHLPDRVLHPRRRAAALRALASRPRPGAVLFVCEGNIYRSPYAAGLARALLATPPAPPVRVESAGFVGPGRPSPAAAREVARRSGVDLTRHRSALLTAQALARADLVVVMDVRQRAALRGRFAVDAARVLVLGDLDPLPVRTRGVADPWGGGAEVLEGAYARIGRCVAALVRALPAR